MRIYQEVNMSLVTSQISLGVWGKNTYQLLLRCSVVHRFNLISRRVEAVDFYLIKPLHGYEWDYLIEVSLLFLWLTLSAEINWGTWTEELCSNVLQISKSALTTAARGVPVPLLSYCILHDSWSSRHALRISNQLRPFCQNRWRNTFENPMRLCHSALSMHTLTET